MNPHIKTDQNDELGIAERLVDLLTFKNKRIKELETKIEELESNVEMIVSMANHQKNEYMSELQSIASAIGFDEDKTKKESEASKEKKDERHPKS